MRHVVLASMFASAIALSEDSPRTLKLDLGEGTALDLVEVPAGSFEMGAPESEKEREACEAPVHAVEITRAFFLGKCEVTNAQFRRFRPGHHSGYAGGKLDGDAQPVLYVSWYDAVAFCAWLSAKSGKNVRLPSEAEWEYACRAGTKTRFHSGDDIQGVMSSGELAAADWYAANAKGTTQPVGQKPANAFGLHDMHGNAMEWCWDWFGADYYAASPKQDPPGPESGVARVVRGGSYYYWLAVCCRSAYRYRNFPERRESVVGFRVAMGEGPLAAEVKAPEPVPAKSAPHFRPVSERERDVAQQFGTPVFTVHKPAAPPSIDGKLDDEAWQKAPELLLRFIGDRAGLPTQATRVRMLADTEKIWFAFDCDEAEMAQLKVAGKKRDDPVWQGDSVEVFLDPQHAEAPSGYIQLIVNPDGQVMDVRDGKKAWNAPLEVAASKHERGWRVEAALPLAALDLAADAIPTVWGVNFARHRPAFGLEQPRLVQGLKPSPWPVDRPEALRLAEDSGWSRTFFSTNHVPERFGHAVFEVGKRETKPPEKIFELLAREDFASGSPGKFGSGTVVDGGLFGYGKMLEAKEGSTVSWSIGLNGVRDAGVLVAIRSTPGERIHWFARGKIHGENKLCPGQTDTLTRHFIRPHPSFGYNHHAATIEDYNFGFAEPYRGGWEKHQSWYSENNIGYIAGHSGEWSVAHTRLAHMRTQKPDHKPIDLDEELHAIVFAIREGQTLHIGEAVLYRGLDSQAPEKVQGIVAELAADGSLALRWQPAQDNTLTTWYRVWSGGEKPEEVLAEVAALSAQVPAAKAKGRNLFVTAVDYFENESEPSDPISVP